MMLLVGARATAVVVSVGEHLGGEKGFVKESDRLVDGYRKRNPMGPVETIGIVAEKYLPFFFLQALVFFFPFAFVSAMVAAPTVNVDPSGSWVFFRRCG